ncbi:TDE2712 family protein, partial [Romboutsia sp.]|uniref:TDE2712 family protein n=1 Tax=Romboutsia sp. TaxID=1965302 RepID=UPI003F3BE66B
MAKIIIKNEILEMMLYVWDSIHQREKIADSFFIGLSNQEDMKCLYGEDFTKDSVRKVLSAISNREILNAPTKKESRYWNKNMWMLEDLNFTNMMVAPVKHLN